MNTNANAGGLGQPTPTSAPAPKRTGLRIILVMFLMLISLILGLVVGGAGGWFGHIEWLKYQDQQPVVVVPEGYRQLAPGIGVEPASDPGKLLFSLSPELAGLWNSPEKLAFDRVDVPVNASEARAASDDLAQAIRERDDEGAIYRLLCLLGAEPDVKRAADYNLLEAVTQGRRGLVRGMIYAKLRQENEDANGNNALHLSAKHGRSEILRDLADTPWFEITDRNSLGRTALAEAVNANQGQVVDTLLELASDRGQRLDLVNAADNAGNTPLHLASEAGNRGLVTELLQSGADQSAVNNKNQSPADVALSDDIRTLF